MKESNTRRINIEKHTHPTEFIYSCEQTKTHTHTQYIMFGTITNSIRRKILESKKKMKKTKNEKKNKPTSPGHTHRATTTDYIFDDDYYLSIQ